MSVGLLALLDDVAALAKAAAASLDDITAQAAKAGTKAAGVVIDDTAVTPHYVTGFSPARELPIVWKIARGSLRNKLLILLPAALALSLLLPQAIMPLLMLGGLYLCYEGVEKIWEMIFPHAAHAHDTEPDVPVTDARAFEDGKVAGAIRTDFILSAEIMAITLGSVPDAGLGTQAAVLAVVGVLITVGVYGVVALIVKADDVGLVMSGNNSDTLIGATTRTIGRGLVGGMPYFLSALGAVGTAAMVWVGGGIILHGLETYGFDAPIHLIDDASAAAAQAVPWIAGIVGWLVGALGAGVAGVLCGLAALAAVGGLLVPVRKRITVFFG